MIDPAARGAWRELEDKLRPFVARRVQSPADAEDVVQDIFLRLQRGLGSLRDDQRFGPWVYQVARSAVADHWRASARHPVVSGDLPELAAEPSSEDDAGIAKELAHYMVSFVAMLPSPYREALTLTELEGLTQREAASMLGISVSGMKSRVRRGRQHLRTLLEECCHIALDARGGVMSCEPRPDGTIPEWCCNGCPGLPPTLGINEPQE